MVGSNCQLQHSRPIFLGSSRPCHSPSVPFNLVQGRPHPCHMNTWNLTMLTHPTIGHPWHQIWSQIGVVCSINIQNGSIGTDFIPPPPPPPQKKKTKKKTKTIWKPAACGLMVSFDRQAGPTFSCVLSVWTEPDNWVRVQCKAGLDNTRYCYRKPPAVKMWHRGGDFHRLSLVIKQAMLLN